MANRNLHITQPKTPRLHTRARHRQIIDYKTAEEREAEEVEGVRAAIRARKDESRRLLERIKDTKSSSAPGRTFSRTVPASPKFETAKRAVLHEISDRQNASTGLMDVNDMGKTTVKDCSNVNEAFTPDRKQLEQLRTTVPKTPKLATRARATTRPPLFPNTPSPHRKVEETDEPLGRTIPQTPNLSFRNRAIVRSHVDGKESRKVFRARPLPDFVKQHARQEKQVREPFQRTIPEPFELSKTNISLSLSPEKKSSQKCGFKARQLPDFEKLREKGSGQGEWSARKRRTTIPDPFHLRSEILHAEAIRKLEEEEQRRKAKEEEQRKFKARVLDENMLEGPLFVPHLQHKHTESRGSPGLYTEKRAMERADFDEEVKKREEEERLNRKMLIEQEQREEEERMREKRKSTVFKARLLPLSHFHPDIPDAPVRHGTSPHTPALKTRTRAEGLREKYEYLYNDNGSLELNEDDEKPAVDL